MTVIQELHQKALDAARRFFKAEAELLELIQKIDECKGFRDLGHTSLFLYVVGELKLSESTALNFINVARKAVQVPALKTEIQLGNLSVCKARKIVPVLSIQNQAEWIEKARTLPTRSLEKEIARVAPAEAIPERVRYAAECRVSLSLSLDENVLEKIKRVQDLESQRKGRSVTLEETLAVMSAFYIEKNDPLEKAKRAANDRKATAKSDAAIVKSRLDCADVTKHADNEQMARINVEQVMDYPRQLCEVSGGQRGKALSRTGFYSRRKHISAATEHEVVLRDDARCTAFDRGKRCENRRFLHVHHLKPVSLGGHDIPENLTTLCSAHHQMLHRSEMQHMKAWPRFGRL